MQFLIFFAIAMVASYAAFLLMPKPKAASTKAAELQYPTVSAGRPIPKLFGTKTIKDPNILWYGNKREAVYQVKV